MAWVDISDKRGRFIRMKTKIFYKEKMKTEHTIINGDCIEELKKLQEGKVDLIVTDPPFHIGKT